MFKTGEYEGKYSQFDERGVPTHDAAGAELNKSQKKKHEKNPITLDMGLHQIK